MNLEVILGVSKLSDPALIVRSNLYVTKMTNNLYFTLPTDLVKIANVKTASLNLQNALEADESKTKSSTIKKCRRELHRNLRALRNLVEERANDESVSDEERLIIVNSTGMSVKGYSHPGPRVFMVLPGEVSGSVLLVAPGKASAHEWQRTEDIKEYTNRIASQTTTKAHTEIHDLPKVPMAFFHKATYPGRETDWEGPIIFTVS
jgi:hypothetical protein